MVVVCASDFDLGVVCGVCVVCFVYLLIVNPHYTFAACKLFKIR